MRREEDHIAEQTDSAAENDVKTSAILNVRTPSEKENSEEGDGVGRGSEELGLPRGVAEPSNDCGKEEGEGVEREGEGVEEQGVGDDEVVGEGCTNSGPRKRLLVARVGVGGEASDENVLLALVEELWEGEA